MPGAQALALDLTLGLSGLCSAQRDGHPLISVSSYRLEREKQGHVLSPKSLYMYLITKKIA